MNIWRRCFSLRYMAVVLRLTNVQPVGAIFLAHCCLSVNVCSVFCGLYQGVTNHWILSEMDDGRELLSSNEMNKNVASTVDSFSCTTREVLFKYSCGLYAMDFLSNFLHFFFSIKNG